MEGDARVPLGLQTVYVEMNFTDPAQDAATYGGIYGPKPRGFWGRANWKRAEAEAEAILRSLG